MSLLLQWIEWQYKKKTYKSNHVTISLFRHEPKHSEGFFLSSEPLSYTFYISIWSLALNYLKINAWNDFGSCSTNAFKFYFALSLHMCDGVEVNEAWRVYETIADRLSTCAELTRDVLCKCIIIHKSKWPCWVKMVAVLLNVLF